MDVSVTLNLNNMNIQEQLEKIDVWFKDKYPKLLRKKTYEEFNPDGVLTIQCQGEVLSDLHTSALKLLKTAYEEERNRHEKQVSINKYIIENHVVGPFEWHKGRIVEAEANITHLNTKIAEVDSLLDNN